VLAFLDAGPAPPDVWEDTGSKKTASTPIQIKVTPSEDAVCPGQSLARYLTTPRQVKICSFLCLRSLGVNGHFFVRPTAMFITIQ
jgi:hypothetical protein